MVEAIAGKQVKARCYRFRCFLWLINAFTAICFVFSIFLVTARRSSCLLNNSIKSKSVVRTWLRIERLTANLFSSSRCFVGEMRCLQVFRLIVKCGAPYRRCPVRHSTKTKTATITIYFVFVQLFTRQSDKGANDLNNNCFHGLIPFFSFSHNLPNLSLHFIMNIKTSFFFTCSS